MVNPKNSILLVCMTVSKRNGLASPYRSASVPG